MTDSQPPFTRDLDLPLALGPPLVSSKITTHFLAVMFSMPTPQEPTLVPSLPCTRVVDQLIPSTSDQTWAVNEHNRHKWNWRRSKSERKLFDTKILSDLTITRQYYDFALPLRFVFNTSFFFFSSVLHSEHGTYLFCFAFQALLCMHMKHMRWDSFFTIFSCVGKQTWRWTWMGGEGVLWCFCPSPLLQFCDERPRFEYTAHTSFGSSLWLDLLSLLVVWFVRGWVSSCFWWWMNNLLVDWVVVWCLLSMDVGQRVSLQNNWYDWIRHDTIRTQKWSQSQDVWLMNVTTLNDPTNCDIVSLFFFL